MSARALRTPTLRGNAHTRGSAHGALFAAEIRDYAAERLHLAQGGSWAGREAGRAEILELAERMLPAHRDYAPDLFEEMLALAAAAGITPAEALILSGFTDFVDAVRGLGRAAPFDDDCTAVLIPGGRGGPWFAQTWDMHRGAADHVVLLDLQPDDGPAARIFSTVGCQGQIGMNEAGIAVGINNLAASDGRVGVTWPFVVREALRQEHVDAALDAVLRAPLAGGHHYLLLGPGGRGYAVEAMPTHRAVTPLADAPLVRTNHCLHAEGQAREAPRPDALVRSSHLRQEVAARDLEGAIDLDRLCAWLREPTAICRVAEPPWEVETAGAVIARPDTRELWAIWGLPSAGAFERFEVTRHG